MHSGRSQPRSPSPPPSQPKQWTTKISTPRLPCLVFNKHSYLFGNLELPCCIDPHSCCWPWIVWLTHPHMCAHQTVLCQHREICRFVTTSLRFLICSAPSPKPKLIPEKTLLRLKGFGILNASGIWDLHTPPRWATWGQSAKYIIFHAADFHELDR